MQNENIHIDVKKIPDAPRYLFTVNYIFTTPYSTAATFEKENFETGYHVQEFYEICIVSKGSGYHVIEDTVVKAIKGDVFIVPPGRRHAFIGGDGFNVFYIHLSPAFLEQYTPRMKSLPAFLALFEIEPLMRVNGTKYRHLYLEEDKLNEILDILKEASPKHQIDISSMLIFESYIVIALTHLCREYENMQTLVGKNANNDKLLMDSISEIFENYHKNLTIEHLAQIAGLSRTSYIERFKAATGTSPKRFITERRISVAKDLLTTTRTPIVKIAEEVGFYDTAHFSKCFTAAVGISPTEFRRIKQPK